ncbi:MAG: transposase [Candidatus Latescibacteria bacterium]|nr:transposase [Candidatus Latescibacterota bacterium]
MQQYKTRKVVLKRFYLPDCLYFITAVTENRLPVFKDRKNINILLTVFSKYRQLYKFKIIAFCILPDHFHCLIIPSSTANISKIIKAIKGYSSRLINKRNLHHCKIWQHQFLDHIIRKDEDYKNHINYIHNNPLKHKLVTEPADYIWSSYNCYYNNLASVFKIDALPF